MIKTLSCADLDIGVECAFAVDGATGEEVIEKLFMHLGEAHAEIFSLYSDEEKSELRDQMEELLEDEDA